MFHIKERLSLKRALIFLCLLLLLTSCNKTLGGDAFFKHINDIESELGERNWEELTIQANELKDMYKKDKWKLQLLGDEGEYETLDESINKLIAAVKEKDKINVRMELASIQTLFESIYTL